jgi:F0F1-type ATP synthase delta subunit
MMQVNPMQLIQMIKSGKNPQQLMLSILEQQSQNNPMYQNLMMLAKNNRTSDIERIARNLAKERGIDFDKEFNAFRRQFGL